MNCVICETKVPKGKNSVVCSDKCLSVRKMLFQFMVKYCPTNGCDNCWADLHGKCSEQCDREFREARAIGRDLWKFVHLIYANK